MNFLISFWNKLLLVFQSLKGTTNVIEIKTPKNLVGHLTGYSIYGYEMQIFCQKRHYRRSYDKWFIPNENHIAYRIFSIVSNNAPEKLKKACELELVIPQLMNEHIEERRQRQSAIDAYLDILAQSLMQNDVKSELSESDSKLNPIDRNFISKDILKQYDKNHIENNE